MSVPSPEEIKNIINTFKEPLLFRNILKWDILSWGLVDWNKELGEEELVIRCGKNLPTLEPQWERTTKTAKCTFKTFLCGSFSEDEWAYFDYKYLNDNLFNCKEFKKVGASITWESFGFPNLTYKDSTIWIGSKGAHTPCHIDTYGCNLIAQVFGRKEWFICPPEENLQPTRIPYEESSIYSKINFFSPDARQIQNISNARHVVLNPGEVLFLPNGWWHYVENLETAISINVWIPQPQDDEKRVEESVARLIVSQITKELPNTQRNKILNPNMDAECAHQSRLAESLAIIEECVKTATNKRKHKKVGSGVNVKNSVKTEANSSVLSELITTLPKMSREDICEWIEKQNARFHNKPTFCPEDGQDLAAKIIDALLQPDVLALVKSKLV